jgi:hypothetical protein
MEGMAERVEWMSCEDVNQNAVQFGKEWRKGGSFC